MKKIQHTLDSGTRIGSYEIKHVLGIGGFGITYKGYDHTLECDVAIKEYLPGEYAARSSDRITVTPKSSEDRPVYSRGLEQFLREARTLAKFKTPNVVRVNRYLETNGTAYIVMDYEDGQPLSRRLKYQHSLDEKTILGILIPILNGLQVIHDKRVLHRDIKPGNIYLRKSGAPVLLDFGAARQAMQGDEQGKTRTVTHGFSPFEQYDSRGAQGPWTDLYGVGATIYQCITGKAPASAPDRIAAIGEPDGVDPVHNLHNITNSRYSVQLLEAVDWMLKLSPEERPQSADEVLAHLPAANPQSPSKIEQKTTESASGPQSTTVVDMDHGPTVMWTPELLLEAEINLAKYMGPLAKVLVPQAAYKANSLDEFFGILGDTISSKSVRERFLKTMKTKAKKLMPNPLIPSTATKDSRPTSSENISADEPISLASGDPWNRQFVQETENALAEFVGPLAHMMVQKAIKQTANKRQLYQILANDIPNAAERKQFIGSIQKKR